MDSRIIEANVKELAGSINNESFIYDLIKCYGTLKTTVSRLKSGNMNMADNKHCEVLQRNQFLFRSNLDIEVDSLASSKTAIKNKVRFIITTDFEMLYALDTKRGDRLSIKITDIAKQFDFFLPWAGMEKAVFRGEDPADVEAAQKMALLFDHVKAINYENGITKEQSHDLVVFLNRILFCLFAEDTELFPVKSQFSDYVHNRSNKDGSNTKPVIQEVFDVLNTEEHHRGDISATLSAFPYVNGGLFQHKTEVPEFDTKALKMLLELGQDNWSEINPDIFGSMIQAVASSDKRSDLGMHYTSTENIRKCIDPLFMDELREEYEACIDSPSKLKSLQARMSKIKIFDPACGSGNFLITAYKELRSLEMMIIERIQELESETLSIGLLDKSHSSIITLNQFYGIEIDEFAHEIAILSMWLVEHQVNMVFKGRFGYTAQTLPLKRSGNIVQGNSTRLDWEEVCTSSDIDEIYIIGNPPYLGQGKMTKEQKDDVDFVFKDRVKFKYKTLDYISLWFYKAYKYSDNKKCEFSFVSTNSICQGQHIPELWPELLSVMKIKFAYPDFKWSNSAKNKAKVTVVIVGFASNVSNPKIYKDGYSFSAKNINQNLRDAPSTFVSPRKTTISSLPKISKGHDYSNSSPLFLTVEERSQLVNKHPESIKFIKRFIGSAEISNGDFRYCLWISDEDKEEALSIEDINKRVSATLDIRINLKSKAMSKLVNKPHQFLTYKEQPKYSLVLPAVTSEKRDYIPCKFIGSDSVVSNGARVVYDSPYWTLPVFMSKYHMVWTRIFAGRLKSDIRYSTEMCWNTFPIPRLTEEQKELLTDSAFEIMEARAEHPDKTLAQLYDPKLMPANLRAAHDANDKLIESLFTDKQANNDSEIFEILLKHYEMRIAENKNNDK